LHKLFQATFSSQHGTQVPIGNWVHKCARNGTYMSHLFIGTPIHNASLGK